MWKKDDPAPPPAQPHAASWNPPAPATPARPEVGRVEPAREAATIGQSIAVKGDLTGEEDLLVQGRVEGTITLPKHSVVIGTSGQVKADVRAKNVRVEGEVIGNLFGEEEVVVSASGRLQGNITAPRVTLENGCRFKGSIDMEGPKAREEQRAAQREGGRENREERRPEPKPEVARA